MGNIGERIDKRRTLIPADEPGRIAEQPLPDPAPEPVPEPEPVEAEMFTLTVADVAAWTPAFVARP